MRCTAAGIPVPERQPAAPDHPPVELEPRLELEHRVHQEPVGRLVIRVPARPENSPRRTSTSAGLRHLAAEERLVKKRRDAQPPEPRQRRGSRGAIPWCDASLQSPVARRRIVMVADDDVADRRLRSQAESTGEPCRNAPSWRRSAYVESRTRVDAPVPATISTALSGRVA